MRTMQCIFVIVHLVVLGSIWTPAHAGMDSAGVSTLGGQEQTDIQTHGGDVITSGGGLDLSGGDVLGAGHVGATSVEAATVQGGSVQITGTLNNPNPGAVTISDSVTISGQADAVRLRMGSLTPTAPQDVTPKIYVTQEISAAENAVVIPASQISLYKCVPGEMDLGALAPGTWGWRIGDASEDVYVKNPYQHQEDLYQYMHTYSENDLGQLVAWATRVLWTCSSVSTTQDSVYVYAENRNGTWVATKILP